MITVGASRDVVLAAIKDLSDSGAHLVQHQDFSSLAGASLGDWARFAENWDDLKLDTFMADGGTYRYRRYSQFEIDVEADSLTQLPHGPYRQETDVNKLNGGVDRLFEPLTEKFVADPLLRDVLMKVAGIFSGVDGTRKWNVKVTPIRIIAAQDQDGQPTPEGQHRDGATFITSLMIGRNNVAGGESSIFAEAGERLVTTTLSEPGEILLSDDRRTLHGVTAVRPENVEEPGHRDVLIMAYTSL
ncbi:2OG-Fe dioxygenase family protein [Streptomyces sp. NPDC058469]|uniref:2OG-Fe dioxygenase family protein n=1 Tax=Streptomyces sp. NPDC058469 TaxID=3346514 RepID=UPI00366456EA